MRDLFSKAAAYLNHMRKRRLWMRAVSCLACFVVFCTTYALILPAITLEKSAFKPDGNLHTASGAKETAATDSNALEAEYGQIATSSNAKRPPEKMLEAARRFLGYAESEEDYIEEDGERRGFSLFGAYYGRPYEKWDDMFVSYCMEEAEIEDVPNAADSDFDHESWIALLEEAELYRPSELYSPAPCDLVFLDLDEDGAADFVAIAEKIIEDRLTVIAGDSSDHVKRLSHKLGGRRILGYARLAEGEDSRIYHYSDSLVSVDVVLADGSELPEDAVLTVRPIVDAEAYLATASEARLATASNAQEEYAQLKEKAEAAVGREAVKIDFYDIGFYTPEGEYIPVADTATVTIRYEKQEEQESAGKVAVLHYQEAEDKPVVLEEIEKKENGDGVTALTFKTEGFSVFAVMTLANGQPGELDGKSFAIVNQADGSNYALSTGSAAVNGVPGLASRVTAVTEEDGIYKVGYGVTLWTFHAQEDGTYTVSAEADGDDGQAVTKYLRLYETPYDESSNDGRGSLTLTDTAENASHIIVTVLEDGRVTMASTANNVTSCINLDSPSNIFWCFNKTEVERSKHILCELAISEADYTGDWVIVNMRKGASSGIAMQSGSVGGNANGNRAQLSVGVHVDEKVCTVSQEEAAVWHFEKQEDGTYYISWDVRDEVGNVSRSYLTIGAKNKAVTLSDTPQKIIVSEGTGDYSGMVRLTNTDGMAVNLFGGGDGRGFGSYNDFKVNEWHTLCQKKGQYDIIKTAVNHPSSVINLFDYWIVEKNSDDSKWTKEQLKDGINDGRSLKFSNNGYGIAGEDLESFNRWTGKDGYVYPGIVQTKLGSDGYPVLQVGDGESLNYLFNPNTENDYRETHRNVSGLLQIDSQGYYYYNSAENFAEYNEKENRFDLYDSWGVTPGGSSPNGQFFPFNSMNEVVNLESTDSKINHYLGLTLTTRFVQKYGGHTNSAKTTDTVFNFAGDDDVWIFIDDVLVADLGGIHDAASVSINFNTGEVEIGVLRTGETYSTDKLKHIFETAFQAEGKELDAEKWNGNTFADGTYHTLKFFYLERGNTDSNLHLQYNLTEIPPTAIYKVNQYGTPLEGAKFAVYKADSDYTYVSNTDPENPDIDPVPVYEGVTNSEGEMAFVDADGMPYTLEELKRLFGEYFILKETEAPPNYSIVSDEVHLHIVNNLLLCENTYDSGAWSRSTLQVAAPGILERVDGKTVNYYDLNDESTNGTLFAVVLKYMGAGLSGDGTGDQESSSSNSGLSKKENWAPVYGNDEKGYTVGESGITENDDFITQVIKAAQQNEELNKGEVCFELSASGAMQLSITHLPGDIRKYYYMLENEEKDETEYTIAYYWTEADSLKGATEENTYRINGESKSYEFDRAFGATIEIPNIINRLFVQKLNEEGELINGAKFAMYHVEEDAEESRIYYVVEASEDAEEILVYLEPDTDGDNSGTASVKGEDGSYIYRMNPQTGCIQIGIGTESGDSFEIKYEISPYQGPQTTMSGSSALNISKEDGTAVFSGIENGTYYLREIDVPKGYQLNTKEIMILVADDAVYANAGTEDDGVTVARGPGYLVDTLDRFASMGDIDKTLSWVYEQMRISDESNTFTAYDDGAWEDWGYLKENNTGESGAKADALTTYLEYAPEDVNTLFNFKINEGRYEEVEDKSSLKRRLYTTVGWSYYELYQDAEYGNEHKGQARYEELLNEDQTPQEIAHLFSRSTYVQVTDKKVGGDLEISKKVVNAPASAEYTFTVDLKDASGNSLTDSYSYKIYDIVTTTETVDGEEKQVTKRVAVKVKDENGNDTEEEFEETICDGGMITLKDRQVAVITNLPAGTRYTITESADSAEYITAAVRDDGKVSVGDGTGKKEFNGNEADGTLYWAVEDVDGTKVTDTTSTVEFTNTYPSELTIHKVDSSNHAVSLSGAEFVFYRTDGTVNKYYHVVQDTSETPDGGGDEPASEKAVWEEAGTEGKEPFKLTTDTEGHIVLHSIWDGTYWLEELTAPAGYHILPAPIQVVVENGKLISHTGTTGVGISGDGLILTVSNNPGYKLPNTGGPGTKPYLLGGIALMAGALLYYIYLRKSRREGGM